MAFHARARMAFLFLLLLSAFQGWEGKREYVNQEYGFALSFPGAWTFTVQPHAGGEVRFTLSFAAEEAGVHGLVQVWRIPDLKQFIDQSLLTAPSLEDVGVRPYRLQGLDGYFLTYRQRISGGKIVIQDVWAQKPDHTVYRIAYMVPEALAGPGQTEIFHRLLSSFRLLGDR